MSREAIQTPWMGSRWEPVGTVELSEPTQMASSQAIIRSFPDPMLPAGYEQPDMMAEPTSLPVDEARQAAAEAAIEGVWSLS